MKRQFVLLLLALMTAALLAACGEAQPAAEVRADLPALYEELCALPDMPEMVPVSEKRIRNFYGIDPDACGQLVLSICSDGLRVDEIWLVECRSEEEAKALAERAEARIEQLCAENETYLPEQYAVAREGKVLRKGGTVALFVSPQAETMAELFEKAFH